MLCENNLYKLLAGVQSQYPDHALYGPAHPGPAPSTERRVETRPEVVVARRRNRRLHVAGETARAQVPC